MNPVLPVLLATLLRRKNPLQGDTNGLHKVDRFLARKAPGIGRYYWETIIVLEK